MMPRLAAAAGLAASLLFSSSSGWALTSKDKMETCTFGANDQKLLGAARKSFMAKCMANKDSPRGKPAKPNPKPQ
jgi:hypothetical protein